MTPQEELLLRFGQNPYGFFWLLSEQSTHPHLNLAQQNRISKEAMKDIDWFEAYQDRAELIALSDNGDYIFFIPEGILLCNPRYDLYEIHRIQPEAFFDSARALESQILPDDL